jgi:hypothetical protein
MCLYSSFNVMEFVWKYCNWRFFASSGRVLVCSVIGPGLLSISPLSISLVF